MKKVLFSGLFLLCATLPSMAQQAQNNNNGGVLELPGDINRVVSLDAQNVLIVEKKMEDGSVDYAVIPIKHVYSGGIARIFGGTSIPTEQFVSPGMRNGNGNGNGNNQNGGFGMNGFGGNGFGGNQNGGFGGGNQGFGFGGNFGNNRNFGNNGGNFGNFQNFRFNPTSPLQGRN